MIKDKELQDKTVDLENLTSDAYNIILSPHVTKKERDSVVEFKNHIEKNDDFDDAAYWFLNSLLPEASQGKLSSEVRSFYSKVYDSRKKRTGYSELGGLGVVFHNI